MSNKEMVVYIPIFESFDGNIFDSDTQKTIGMLEKNMFIPDIKFSEMINEDKVKMKIWIWRKKT